MLGACLQRCQTELKHVTIGICKELIESLVESSMMYEIEIWGCGRYLGAIKHVQRVLYIFTCVL